jgi:TnpA family transposase
VPNTDLRKRIGRQLKKGEELGALKDFLFFANDGNIRKRLPGEQTHQALCLSLLVDAVIAWNTVCFQRVLHQLTGDGYLVNEEDLSHLSPTRHAHVNPYGRYRFDPDAAPAGGDGLRPLRRA